MAETGGFIFGGDTGLTYEQLKQRRAIAQALAGQRRQLPQTFGEGLAYLGQSFGDALAERGLYQAEQQQRERDRAAVESMNPKPAAAASVPYRDVTSRPFTSQTEGPPVPVAQPAPNIPQVATRPSNVPLLGHGAFDPNAPAPNIQGVPQTVPENYAPNFTETQPAEVQGPAQPPAAAGPRIPSTLQLQRRAGISGIESSVKGDPYQAVGSVTGDGDRAYGKYQIMGKNVGDWTQAALGVRMTPAQFLADPKAQDDTFDHRMGYYANRYGEEGAAKAWYAGEKGMNNPNATDMHQRLTTTTYGQDYMRRFNAAGQQAPAAPGAPAGAPQAAAPPPQADPRASLTATLAGGGQPIRLASLGGAGGTMSDAPPPGANPMTPLPADAENPPTPTNIPAVTTTPNTQLAQLSAPNFSMPGARVPYIGGTAPAPAAPAAPPVDKNAVSPPPEPLAYPDPGPEPVRPQITQEMIDLRKMEGNANLSPHVQQMAGKRYEELRQAQREDYTREWNAWNDKRNKQIEYNMGDPQRRQALMQHHLANTLAQRQLEGEGYYPVSAERMKTLQIGGGKLPAGQVVYENRRGELKFGPTPPANTQFNMGEKAEEEAKKDRYKLMNKHYVEVYEGGNAAADDLRTLTEMRVLAERVGTGPGAVAKQLAGRWGIKLQGTSDVEALNATINRLVPQQRVPGAGATSDFDARMFQAAVPALMNTPEGNRIIMDTMEGIARNKLARSEIAGKVLSDQIGYADAMKGMLALQEQAKLMSDRVRAHLENQGIKSESLVPRNYPSPSESGLTRLRANPTETERKQFDAVFGPGAADRALGVK